MRSFARILLCSACLLSLSALPPAFAEDEEAAAPVDPTAIEIPKGNFGKEMVALGEATALLSKVKDEASATEAAEQICKKFAKLPPQLGGTTAELELLAKAQNRASDQMERLMAFPWFVSSGLQEAWTLMTDPFSRRSAQKRRRK